MTNVTISLDEQTARWARLEAARRETSVSHLVGELLARYTHEYYTVVTGKLRPGLPLDEACGDVRCRYEAARGPQFTRN